MRTPLGEDHARDPAARRAFLHDFGRCDCGLLVVLAHGGHGWVHWPNGEDCDRVTALKDRRTDAVA